jgi:hypothetical protein
LNQEETAMKSRLTLAVLLLASLPGFAQFNFEITGGNVKFGSAPLNITVVHNGGTHGALTNGTPCAPNPQVRLAGKPDFVINGTMSEFGRNWEVEFVLAPAGFANQGTLNAGSISWEMTGKYKMTIREVGTAVSCTKVVGASGEYQWAGPKLAGWPAKCPGPPTNAPGQSPGLTGTLVMRGHANIFPVFTPGPNCPAPLAAQWNTKIGGKGFDAVHLDYKLTY